MPGGKTQHFEDKDTSIQEASLVTGEHYFVIKPGGDWGQYSAVPEHPVIQTPDGYEFDYSRPTAGISPSTNRTVRVVEIGVGVTDRCSHVLKGVILDLENGQGLYLIENRFTPWLTPVPNDLMEVARGMQNWSK